MDDYTQLDDLTPTERMMYRCIRPECVSNSLDHFHTEEVMAIVAFRLEYDRWLRRND